MEEKRGKAGNSTLIRVLSSVVGLPLLIACVGMGGWWLKAGLCVIALIGMREVYTPLSGGFKLAHLLGYSFGALYILFIDHMSGRLMFIPVAGVVFVSLAAAALLQPRVKLIDAGVAVFGFFYVAFLLGSVYLLRTPTRGGLGFGAFAVWLPFIAAWGCDTGAYIVGRAIGKHKLMPNLSPKKTVEGAVGGVIFAVVLSFIYVFCMGKFFAGFEPPARAYAVCALICAAGAVLGQVGDLAASAIKRFARIKDFGNVIPGHGGVMDRFDSVLFTAPFVYGAALILWR